MCPIERKEDFLRTFEGHQLYTLRSRLLNQLTDWREAPRAEAAAAAVDETNTKDQRIEAVLDTTKLAERIGQVKAEIRQLEENLVRHEQELDAYLEVHPPLLTSH